MPEPWPPRDDLCAVVQARLARGIDHGETITGALVQAMTACWPHLSVTMAYHLARVGQITDWTPQPRPPVDCPYENPPTLRQLAMERVKHLVPHCGRCGWSAPVPLQPLVDRLGGDVALPDLLPAFVCRWCKGRADTVRDDMPTAAPRVADVTKEMLAKASPLSREDKRR